MRDFNIFAILILTLLRILHYTSAFPFASDIVFNFNGLSKQLQLTQKEAPPRDYISFDGSYYKYHRGPQIWSKARQICEAEGGHLAIINSEDEAAFLLGIMNKYPNDVLTDVIHKDYILLGFHGYFKVGEYTTIDGKSIESSGYIHWAHGQPDGPGKENCGSLYRHGGLNDFACDIAAPYICEITSKPCNLSNHSEPFEEPPRFDVRGSANLKKDKN